MSRLFGLVLLLAGAMHGHALMLQDIDFVVGSGTNEAGLVIDWNDGVSAESVAWAYRWDGVATGFDMIQAIAAADPRLDIALRPTASGDVVFGLAYDADNSGNAFSFTAIGNETATVSSPDHLKEGWMLAGFWEYFTGAGTSEPAWTTSLVGSAQRQLADQSWDGWSFADAFISENPGPAVAAVVPEPSSSLLALSALALKLRRSRRRR